MNTTEFKVYDRLVQEHDFMRSIEISKDCQITPARLIPVLDRLYGSRLIMARFALNNQAIIVTCDEVKRPEIGFSKKLDVLLKGIGMNRDNWVDTVKSYATLDQDGGFPDFVPEGISPLEVFNLDSEHQNLGTEIQDLTNTSSTITN